MKLLGSKVLPIALVALASFFLAGPIAMPVNAKSPRIIEITAKQFGFAPDTITLKKDETVILRLKREDATHGFFIRALKLDEDIAPGAATDLTVTPTTTGTFMTFRDHFCGANHGNMKMTIVVE